MTRIRLFRLKNAMLISNLISNVSGVVVILFLSEGPVYGHPPEILELSHRIHMFFLPLAFVLPTVLTIRYERPIRQYLELRYEKKPLTEETILKARQKLLNEPFFLIALASGVWLTAAVVYSMVFCVNGAVQWVIRTAFLRSFYTGLITITVAFFVFEYVLQRRLVPYFFPNGGLSTTPGTLRIRISTRLIALFFACNLIPLIIVLKTILRRFPALNGHPHALEQIQSTILNEVLMFIGLGMWMTFLISSNLTKPLKEITQVLHKVKAGLFEGRVRVTSNDEIGYAGDVMNEMIEGLIERDRLQQSLALAKEIQDNLLPREDLRIAGFEVAGKCVYCDETGGDYYDFIDVGGNGGKKAGIVIADVSGHGISSALLMATVRSSLRQRSSLPGTAAQIVSDVNRQLVKDVDHSGNFVTMFFLTIDTERSEFEWVRAGHNPAIVYDPATDSFAELAGPGIALGIDSEWIYSGNRRSDLTKGQVVFLGTDGVWEVHNKNGEMLGKGPIFDVIRRNHSSSAKAILADVLDTVARHRRGAPKEDDITLVIIKMLDEP